MKCFECGKEILPGEILRFSNPPKYVFHEECRLKIKPEIPADAKIIPVAKVNIAPLDEMYPGIINMQRKANELSKKINNCILQLLKGNGFRPKNTEKYIRGLQKRLEKKGLRIEVEVVYEGIEKDAYRTIYSETVKVKMVRSGENETHS